MRIISDYTRDSKTEKPRKGSYEWWYFDGLANNGEYGFTIIFYEGNPFSRRYIELQESSDGLVAGTADLFPALSISVYKEGKPIYYGFREHSPDEAYFASDKVNGKIGGSEFTGIKKRDNLHYELILDQILPGGDQIKGVLEFVSSSKEYLLGKDMSGEMENDHEWNLVQPDAMVTGEIFIEGFETHKILFDGPGYHDHNTGLEPMDQSFRDWYWGRFHFKESTLVYYLMQRKEGPRHKAWLINRSDQAITAGTGFRLEDKGFNLFGLHSARKIEIRGKGINCFIQHEKVIDSGPFYQRFQSKAVVETKDGLKQAVGFSEYIHPSRIKNRIFWPLINMRIAYPIGKPHWVQRNPWLYRWTW